MPIKTGRVRGGSAVCENVSAAVPTRRLVIVHEGVVKDRLRERSVKRESFVGDVGGVDVVREDLPRSEYCTVARSEAEGEDLASWKSSKQRQAEEGGARTNTRANP